MFLHTTTAGDKELGQRALASVKLKRGARVVASSKGGTNVSLLLHVCLVHEYFTSSVKLKRGARVVASSKGGTNVSLLLHVCLLHLFLHLFYDF